MKTFRQTYILLHIVIIILLGLKLSGITDLLNLENFKLYKNTFVTYIDQYYLPVVIIHILTYIIVTAFSIPGANIMTFTGGLLFGTIISALYVNDRATIGATLSFLFSRYLMGNQIQKKFSKQLQTFNRDSEENGINYMLTLRFIPLFPFFLVNLLTGVTKIPVYLFIWTTSLGILPGSLVYAYAGRQLGSINATGDIMSTRILTAFIALGYFALIPAILKK